jgi:hypothetical protein
MPFISNHQAKRILRVIFFLRYKVCDKAVMSTANAQQRIKPSTPPFMLRLIFTTFCEVARLSIEITSKSTKSDVY